MKNLFFIQIVVVLSIFCLAFVAQAEPVRNNQLMLVSVPSVDPTIGLTKLMKAAKIGDLPSLKLAFDKEENVNVQNENGVTALMIAAKYGNETAVDFLLEHGAKIDLKSKQGYKAVDFAKMFGHKKIVAVLLAAK